MIVRRKVDQVVIRRGSTNPVAVVVRDIGKVSLYRQAIEGPQGRPGERGRDGDAIIPEVLDGGNF